MAIEQTPELERILQEAADRMASDVFLIPDEPVAFRVQGRIERSDCDPLTAPRITVIAAAAVGQEELRRVPLETGGALTSCGLPGVADGRMTIATTMGESTIVIRMLPGTVMDVKAAGVPGVLLKATEAMNGLIVVGGPTGSGKTTVALSLLDYINATRPVHIITVEDPVLARLTPKQALVQHREVGTDIPDTVSGIRWALKQDPDVLYVSELKSIGELEAVVTMADAGHLVLTVMHGFSPEDIVQRILDVHPPETREAFHKRLASVLRAVSVQRLLRKAGGKGRVAAYGVLIPDDDTRQAIVAGTDLKQRSAPLPEGCHTLADDIRRLREEGTVSADAAEEALTATGEGR
jgi:twitching motility protein PilT